MTWKMTVGTGFANKDETLAWHRPAVLIPFNKDAFLITKCRLHLLTGTSPHAQVEKPLGALMEA